MLRCRVLVLRFGTVSCYELPSTAPVSIQAFMPHFPTVTINSSRARPSPDDDLFYAPPSHPNAPSIIRSRLGMTDR